MTEAATEKQQKAQRAFDVLEDYICDSRKLKPLLARFKPERLEQLIEDAHCTIEKLKKREIEEMKNEHKKLAFMEKVHAMAAEEGIDISINVGEVGAPKKKANTPFPWDRFKITPPDGGEPVYWNGHGRTPMPEIMEQAIKVGYTKEAFLKEKDFHMPAGLDGKGTTVRSLSAVPSLGSQHQAAKKSTKKPAKKAVAKKTTKKAATA
jgi:DNA-binding protein H-NS